MTGPVNPFREFSETVAGAVVPPTWGETEAGATEMAKSGVGAGCGDEDPPHPVKMHKEMSRRLEMATRWV